jgi:hypothetical protein
MLSDLPVDLITKSCNTTISGGLQYQIGAVNYCLAALDPALIREVVVYSSSATITNCFTTSLKIRYAAFDMESLIKLQARGCMDKSAGRRQTVLVLNNLGHNRTWHDFPEIVKLFTTPQSENFILINCVRKVEDAPLVLCSSLFILYPPVPLYLDLAPIFEQILPDVIFTKLVQICMSLKPHEGLACARPLYFKKVPYMFVLRCEPALVSAALSTPEVSRLCVDSTEHVKYNVGESGDRLSRSSPNPQILHFFKTVIGEACAMDDTLQPLREDFDVLLRKHGWRPNPPVLPPAFVPEHVFGQRACSVDIYGGAKSGRSTLAIAVLSLYPELKMTAGLLGHGAEPLRACVPAACSFKDSATFFKYANKSCWNCGHVEVACVLDGMMASEQNGEWHKAKLCARVNNKLIVSVNSCNVSQPSFADVVCLLKAPSTQLNLRYWSQVIPEVSAEQVRDIMEALDTYDAMVYVKFLGLFIWKHAGVKISTRSSCAGGTLYKELGVLLDAAEQDSTSELLTLITQACNV